MLLQNKVARMISYDDLGLWDGVNHAWQEIQSQSSGEPSRQWHCIIGVGLG